MDGSLGYRGRGARAPIARPALAAQLRRAWDAGAVVVVAAGAGFGKTTVLQEALQSRGGPWAWVSCAQTSGDSSGLLANLVEAVRDAVPGAVEALTDRLVAAPGSIDVFAAGQALVRELDRLLVDPLVLVFDDAEELGDRPQALDLVDVCLRSNSARLQVAVASRRWLPLRLAKLRAAGRVVDVGEAELAFDARECAKLMRDRLGAEPSPELVEAILRQTEGWPLAVALAAVAPHSGVPGSGSREELFGFLAEEVLGRLDSLLRAAVLDSSIALQLSAPVTAALGLPEGFLDEVERRDLFLRAVDRGRGWFSYHPLFRAFLRQRFEQERAPSQRRALHARLGRALLAEHPVEAIEHLLHGGEEKAALEAMAHRAPLLLNTAPAALRRWHEQLSPELREYPAACLLEGRLELAAGRPERAVDPLRAAVAKFRLEGDAAGEWAARFPLADILFFFGRCDDLVELAEDFDSSAAQAAGVAAPMVAILTAIRLIAEGRLLESDALAQRARTLSQDSVVSLLESSRRAYLDWFAGRGDEAIENLTAIVHELQRTDPFQLRGPFTGAIGHIAMEYGREQQALDALQDAIDLHDLSGTGTNVPVQARALRALLLARQGSPAAAEAELTQVTLASPVGWRAYLASAARASIASRRGDDVAALASADQALREVAAGPRVERTSAGDWSWTGTARTTGLGARCSWCTRPATPGRCTRTARASSACACPKPPHKP